MNITVAQIPPSVEQWSLFMDNLTRHPIDHSPWVGYSQEPKASFSIAYTKDAILLKYYVSERDPRVTFHTTNDPVYQDSCVEFFITFESSGPYYNLEFNPIGTCLMGYGAGRAERIEFPAELIQTIDVFSSLPSPRSPASGSQASENNNSGSDPASGQSAYGQSASGQPVYDKSIDWSLTLKIPLQVFKYDKINALTGTKARANFYKCGDECIAPHYLTWNNILAPEPNFHQPGDFGELSFL
ncbi:carbohydrate-binding family 9-like protein [Flavitalea flava]